MVKKRGSFVASPLFCGLSFTMLIEVSNSQSPGPEECLSYFWSLAFKKLKRKKVTPIQVSRRKTKISKGRKTKWKF